VGAVGCALTGLSIIRDEAANANTRKSVTTDFALLSIFIFLPFFLIGQET
jgi:hypothetical protein